MNGKSTKTQKFREFLSVQSTNLPQCRKKITQQRWGETLKHQECKTNTSTHTHTHTHTHTRVHILIHTHLWTGVTVTQQICQIKAIIQLQCSKKKKWTARKGLHFKKSRVQNRHIHSHTHTHTHNYTHSNEWLYTYSQNESENWNQIRPRRIKFW